MNDEVAAHFRGVRSLRAALLVTVDRELPIAVWQRHPAAEDAAAGAAYATRAMRSLGSALTRLGFPGAPERLTVELAGAVAMYTPVDGHLSALFVFAADTPLGLVRLHVERLCDQLRAHRLADVEDAPAAPPAPAPIPAPAAEAGDGAEPESPPSPEAPSQPARVEAAGAGPSTDPMRPDRVPQTSRYEEGDPSEGARKGEAGPGEERPPRSRTDVPMAPARDDRPPRSRTDVPMAPAAGSRPPKKTLPGVDGDAEVPDEVPPSSPISVPRPPNVPTGTDPPPPPSSEGERSGADPAGAGSSGGETSDEAPETTLVKTQGERLLEHLETYAPDAHAALLRVSLQTGLPMALLRTPERMSSDEIEQVEASVKRILGKEDLSY